MPQVKNSYRIERMCDKGLDTERWITIPCMNSIISKQFCEGFLCAMDSLYPSKPYRYVNEKTNEVIRETKGRNNVHCN